MNIEQLFFELLQVAIGTRTALSRTPSAEEWKALFALSKKQSLVGISFNGVSRLKELSPDEDGFGSSIGIPGTVYLKWMGLMVKTSQRNKEMNAECVRLVKQLKRDGLDCCILKGQSNLVYYPEKLRGLRSSGDIDVLMRQKASRADVRGVIEYCLMQARLLEAPRPHVTYHHTDLVWDGATEVEAHYRATFLCSPIRNHRLQHWLEENMPFNVCAAVVGGNNTKTVKTAEVCVSNSLTENSSELGSSVKDSSTGSSTAQDQPSVNNNKNIISFPIPTVSYNAIYQLLHIYKHLFEEGIGLRQLLDYYFVLKALSCSPRLEGECHLDDKSLTTNEEIMHTLSRFGMKKFASATMYVLQTVFAMPDEYLICQPNEKEGKFLLNEIMQAGNFGKYDERIKHGGSQFSHAIEKTKHNFRLLTHYPEEVICEPFFRLYHWLWRRFELWRW